MVSIPIWDIFIWVPLKILFLDHYYFQFMPMTLTIQPDVIPFITLQMIQFFWIITIQQKRINKKVNQDFKNLTNWLNANAICLNISKREVFLFKSSRKVTDVPLKLKFNGKRCYPTNSVKYLGIKTDKNFNWKQQISDTAIKLKRANAILSKLRYFIDRKSLKSVYHEIFQPHLRYSTLFWAQNLNSIKRLFVLQKKSLMIIY